MVSPGSDVALEVESSEVLCETIMRETLVQYTLLQMTFKFLMIVRNSASAKGGEKKKKHRNPGLRAPGL